jgi:uncharacterized protein (TIGR03437 family)
VVYLIWDNTGTAAVSDSLGNTYTAAVGSTLWNNSQYRVQTFYTINSKGGADTVTATFATALSSFGIVYADEYSGVAQTAPIDVTVAAAGASGSLNSGTVTTANATDLLFAGGASANMVTGAGSGYTARSTFEGNITEDQVVTAKGSWSATAGNGSVAWAIQMVAFKAATSGTGGAQLVSALPRSGSPVATGGSASQASSDAASSLRCSPRVITAGGATTCELLVTATSQSVQIPLNSNSEQLLVPAVVATRPNQSSLTFQAETSEVSKQQKVTIAATFAAGAVQDTILVMPASGPVLRAPRRQIAKAGVPMSFAVGAIDPSELPTRMEANSIPAGASFNSSTGVFAWAPQASQVGKYAITFTATNSARQSSRAQVDLQVDAGTPTLDVPESSCSPGAIGTLRGKWLAAADSRISDASGASFDLAGTSVIVNGQAVPVLYSSSDQVDFLCPALGTGTQLSVAVSSRFGASQATAMGMVEATPTILSIGDSNGNQGLISFHGSNDLVMERNYRVPAHPAQPGDQIVILATGLGSAAEALSRTMLVKLGDVSVGVESVEAVPGHAGIYGIEMRVPAAMSFGAVPVQLQLMMPGADSLRSNSVTAVFEAVRQ